MINDLIPPSPAISIIHPGLVKNSCEERKGLQKRQRKVDVKRKKKTYWQRYNDSGWYAGQKTKAGTSNHESSVSKYDIIFDVKKKALRSTWHCISRQLCLTILGEICRCVSESVSFQTRCEHFKNDQALSVVVLYRWRWFHQWICISQASFQLGGDAATSDNDIST